jgi:DNA adenine methylase
MPHREKSMNDVEEENHLGGPPRQRRGVLNPYNYGPPLPIHATYVETRGSYGAWIFRKSPSSLEVLNDVDGEALNLSRAIIDRSMQTPFVQQYAMASGVPGTVANHTNGDERVTRATQFAHAIEHAIRGMSRTRKSVLHRSRLHLTPGLDRLDGVFDRLRKVQLESGTTAKLIERYDWQQTLFLCDERGTAWDSQVAQELIVKLHGAAGKIILIANDVPASIQTDARWNRVKHVKATGGSAEEVVWTNF